MHGEKYRFHQKPKYACAIARLIMTIPNARCNDLQNFKRDCAEAADFVGLAVGLGDGAAPEVEPASIIAVVLAIEMAAVAVDPVTVATFVLDDGESGLLNTAWDPSRYPIFAMTA
jgi:hypothetical protein